MGAVYVTEVLVGLLRVPPPEAGEVIAQDAGLTPAFAGSKLTVAVINDVPPACTWPADAARETLIAASSTLTVADTVGAATEVAVIVTVTSPDGGVAGAL